MANLEEVVKLYNKAVKLGHKEKKEIAVEEVIRSVERKKTLGGEKK